MEKNYPRVMETQMISTEPEYPYDPLKDIHFFNPMLTERPAMGRSRDRSTLVVQNSRGITTIPVYSAEKPHNHIVDLHSVETQTEDLATHCSKELFETVQDESIIETDLIAYVNDHRNEDIEIPEDVESFIDEMLDLPVELQIHLRRCQEDLEVDDNYV